MRTHARASLGIALAAVMACIIGVSASLSVVSDAEAHAALIRSNPANSERVVRAPIRVTLFFSEPLERKLTRIEVFDSAQKRVDEDDIEFDDNNSTFASIGLTDLEPGLYIVQYDNVSTVDGHPWSGVIQFIVLNPDGTTPAGAEFDPEAGAGSGTTGLLPSALDSALKWIALLSLATTVGAAFWMLAVSRPAGAFMSEEDERSASERTDHAFSLIAHTLMPLAFVAMAFLIAVTVQRFETPTTLWSYLTSIRSGQYRLTLEGLTLLSLVALDVFVFARNKTVKTASLLTVLAAGAGGLFTYSLTSHGAADDGAFWAVTSDAVHLFASALWLGALVMLVPYMRWIRPALKQPERFLHTANVFDRFSTLAGISIIAMMASGTFNGLAQIPQFDALWETTYGRVLLVKLGLIVPLLAVGAVNALVLKPRLVAAIDALYQEGGPPRTTPRQGVDERLASLQGLLPKTIVAEIVLVIAVFASVAVLTQTSTAKGEIAQVEAREQSAGGFRDTKPAGDLQLDFEATPNLVGLNRFTVTARNEDGSFATDITQFRLRFFYTDPTNPNLSTGQTELELQRFGEGFYRGSGAYFSQPGSWRVEAGIRREGKDDVSRNFVLSVAPASSGDTRETGRFSLPFTSLGWNEVLGALIILLGGCAILYGKQIAPAVRTSERWVSTFGAGLAVAGFVLAFAVSTGGAGGGLARDNPIKPTEDSILAGRMLFQQNCRVCHGDTGRGDGPQAAQLDPSPTDFRLHLPLHTDPQFFAFIANGFPGSAMPAWREQFSDEEIWNLVNFLRSEFSEAPTE